MNPLSSLTGLCAVGFFARLSYSLARSPVLPLFALHLGAGPEAIGFVVGISTVTGIFFKLPSGALSDVIGRRKTMLIGLFVFALMPFSYLFFVRDYYALSIVRLLHGFATAVYGPVSMAVVADIAGNKKGEMLSWFSSVTITGNLLGAPVGGLLLYSLAAASPSLDDFRNVYLLSGCAGMISLLLASRLLAGKEAPREGTGLRNAFFKFCSGMKEVVSDKRVVVTSSMEGLQNMTMGALEAFLPIYAVKVAGLNEFQAGLLWGVQVLVTILSKPIMGKSSDRYGRKPVIALGMVLCALSFASIPMLESFYALMVAATFFGLGEAFVTSSSAALVADACEEKHFGAAMGTFGTILDTGTASGPILAGILIAKWGYLHAFSFMGAMLILAVPVFMLSVDAGRSRKMVYEGMT